MKQSIAWKSALLVFVILLFDQILKVWVKTNMSIGEDIPLLGNWFHIHFVENPGMAFGWQLGGKWGKLVLSLFRLVAIAAIIWYIRILIREKAPNGFILCVSLILAGAMGNMIDCAFYGLLFSESNFGIVAEFLPEGGGYAPFLFGKVVDMLSFPIIHGTYPGWFPLVGGEEFLFFRPVFNIADSAVTIGVLSIILFYWSYLKNISKS
ncbi:MAG: lipoprotein signal peptidase [Bacteroidales bacterium]|nr:lipoprotein signal peptidase [Bacteroidales bacterium]